MPEPLNDVQHHPAVNQFQYHHRGQTAVLDYRLYADHITFLHTEVPELLAGHGVASALAKTGLNFARDHQLRVLPICPFVKEYIARHEAYQPLVMSAHRRNHE